MSTPLAPLEALSPAATVAIAFAGGFFVVGLVCGVWKYHHIHNSAEAHAPVYVDIAHRAALFYAFACLLIERFVHLSQLADRVELWAVLAQVVFFALAVMSYVTHGILQDTDNQLAKPHRLGGTTMPSWAMRGFMFALIAGEIGGFMVLLYGVLV